MPRHLAATAVTSNSGGFALTNRDIRVIRHFVKKGVLPAEKNERGDYLVKWGHVAIVLWQPAWKECLGIRACFCLDGATPAS